MAIYVTRQYDSNYSYPSTIFSAGSWPQDYTRSWSLSLNIMDNFWPELKEHVVSISAKAKNNGAAASGNFYYQIISNSTQSRFQVYIHQSENIDIPVNLVEIRVTLDMYILSATPSSRFTIEGVNHNILVFKPNTMEWVFDSGVDYKVRLDPEAHVLNYNFISWDKLDLTKSYNKDIFPYYKTSDGVYHENNGTTILNTIPNGESLLMLKTASYLFNETNYLKNAWKSFEEKDSIFEENASGSTAFILSNPLQWNCYRNDNKKLKGIGDSLGLKETELTNPRVGYRYQGKASDYFNLIDKSSLIFLGDMTTTEAANLPAEDNGVYLFIEYSSEYQLNSNSQYTDYWNGWLVKDLHLDLIDKTLRYSIGHTFANTVSFPEKLNINYDYVQLKESNTGNSLNVWIEVPLYANVLPTITYSDTSNPKTDWTILPDTVFYSSTGTIRGSLVTASSSSFEVANTDRNALGLQTSYGVKAAYANTHYAGSWFIWYQSSENHSPGSGGDTRWPTEYKFHQINWGLKMPVIKTSSSYATPAVPLTSNENYVWKYAEASAIVYNAALTYVDGDQFDRKIGNALFVNKIDLKFWNGKLRGYRDRYTYWRKNNTEIKNCLTTWKSMTNSSTGGYEVRTYTIYPQTETTKRILAFKIPFINS